MKKWKFVVSIVMAVMVVVALGFGVYAAVKGTGGVNNTTDFNVSSDNVFVKIVGEYNGPSSTDAGASKTYSYELNKETEGAYDDASKAIPAWKIGSTNFTRQETVMTIDFEFTNLNDENSLKIDITKIAVDSEVKFETEYVVCLNKSDLIEDNYQDLIGTNNGGQIRDIIVDPTETVYVRVVYTLKSFEKTFNFQNNIQVAFTALTEAE